MIIDRFMTDYVEIFGQEKKVWGDKRKSAQFPFSYVAANFILDMSSQAFDNS